MRNIFRKSIVIAGLSLLFLYSCTTLKPDEKIYSDLTIYNLFSQTNNAFLYLNRVENWEIINYFTHSLGLPKNVNSLIEKSFDIYLGFGENIKTEFEGVITGDYSKSKIEFGLFLSLDWKKVHGERYSYWVDKSGLKIYITENGTIVASSLNIELLIDSVLNGILIKPSGSVVYIMPELKDEDLSKLTNGFIKNGINSLEVNLKSLDNVYDVFVILNLESESKARAFERLIKLFLKIVLSTSEYADIISRSSEFIVKSEQSSVKIEKIVIDNKIIIDFINKFIFYEGETDK